jgi:hypothetical protein
VRGATGVCNVLLYFVDFSSEIAFMISEGNMSDIPFHCVFLLLILVFSMVCHYFLVDFHFLRNTFSDV